MKNCFLSLFLILILSSCQKSKEKAEDPKAPLFQSFETRSCMKADLLGPFLSYRVDIFGPYQNQYWEEPHQLREFESDGHLLHLTSADELVVNQYEEAKKSKRVIQWTLDENSNLKFTHDLRPKLSHELKCSIILKNYPAEGHGFKPIVAGSLLLSTDCSKKEACQHHIFRKMNSSEDLRPSFDHGG